MKVQVYILTHNRPHSFIRALKSVESQTYSDFEVIVSDNSTSRDTEALFSSLPHKNNVRYIKRSKEYSPQDHFNLCKNEVDSDYYMLFHDDDTMLPDCLEILVKSALAHPECIAVAGNANVVNDAGKYISKFKEVQNDMYVTSAKELALLFLKDEGMPFPAYLYRKDAQHTDFDFTKAGKYSDSVYLVNIVEKAPVFWVISDMVMNYTVSDTQDSHTIDFTHRRLFLNYMMQKALISKENAIIQRYRSRDIFCYFYANHRFFWKVIICSFINNKHYYCTVMAIISNFVFVTKSFYNRLCQNSSCIGRV